MSAILRIQSAGYNLIEVLVALAVLSFGMLGIAALQIHGVRFSHESYSRTQAVMIANDYAERMYANRPAADAGNYAPFISATGVDCATPPALICAAQSNAVAVVCTPAQMAGYDQFIASCGYPTPDGRFGGVRDLLPQGSLAVLCIDEANPTGPGLNPCPAGNRHRITIGWLERRETANGTTEDVTATYVMELQP